MTTGTRAWPYICSRCRIQLERPATHLCEACDDTTDADTPTSYASAEPGVKPDDQTSRERVASVAGDGGCLSVGEKPAAGPFDAAPRCKAAGCDRPATVLCRGRYPTCNLHCGYANVTPLVVTDSDKPFKLRTTERVELCDAFATRAGAEQFIENHEPLGWDLVPSNGEENGLPFIGMSECEVFDSRRVDDRSPAETERDDLTAEVERLRRLVDNPRAAARTSGDYMELRSDIERLIHHLPPRDATLDDHRRGYRDGQADLVAALRDLLNEKTE